MADSNDPREYTLRQYLLMRGCERRGEPPLSDIVDRFSEIVTDPDLPRLRHHARERLGEAWEERLIDWLCAERGIGEYDAERTTLSDAANFLEDAAAESNGPLTPVQRLSVLTTQILNLERRAEEAGDGLP